jgi:hypothetical protein
MKFSIAVRRAAMLMALTIPSLCWGFGPPAKTALVVTETGSGFQTDINAVVSFLSGRLTTAGYTVTSNVGVPGSLSGYNEIWDIRADTALSGSDITAYVAYMAGGGSLFAMGENGTCCSARDASVAALITAAGGGTVTLETNSANLQTVQAPFTGPVSLTTITYADIGGFTSAGSGAFITKDTATSGGALIFGPGTMTNATSGVLASVLDVNFMDNNPPGSGLSQALTDNLIAYLGAPTVIPNSPLATPGPPTALLVAIGMGGAWLVAARRRPEIKRS